MAERPSILLLTLLLLVTAPAALALPVEVALSGLVSDVAGVAPGGIADSTPFTASIGYDPGADQDPGSQIAELPGHSFSLQLEVGGESFAFDPASGPARFRFSVSWVDEDGVPAEPDEPDAMLLWAVDGYGAIQHVGTNATYMFAGRFNILPGRHPPNYMIEWALPPTAAEAAQLMADGPARLGDYLFLSNASEICWSWAGPSSCNPDTSDFWIEATIASATAIPEPTTALLLLLGVVAICTAERVRRNTVD